MRHHALISLFAAAAALLFPSSGGDSTSLTSHLSRRHGSLPLVTAGRRVAGRNASTAVLLHDGGEDGAVEEPKLSSPPEPKSKEEKKKKRGAWWRAAIEHNGTAPYSGDPHFEYYRDVVRYGADSTGVNDSSAAFNAAISGMCWFLFCCLQTACCAPAFLGFSF